MTPDQMKVLIEMLVRIEQLLQQLVEQNKRDKKARTS